MCSKVLARDGSAGKVLAAHAYQHRVQSVCGTTFCIRDNELGVGNRRIPEGLLVSKSSRTFEIQAH